MSTWIREWRSCQHCATESASSLTTKQWDCVNRLPPEMGSVHWPAITADPHVRVWYRSHMLLHVTIQPKTFECASHRATGSSDSKLDYCLTSLLHCESISNHGVNVGRCLLRGLRGGGWDVSLSLCLRWIGSLTLDNTFPHIWHFDISIIKF